MKVLDTDLFRDEDFYLDAVGLGLRDSYIAQKLLFSVSNFPFGDSSYVRLV